MIQFKDIQDYANKIAERFNPEKIILFGSYANGQPNEDSDVDLLVITDFEGKSYEKATEIRLAIEPPFPLDMLVRSSSDFFRMVNELHFFWREVYETGITLYDREYVEVAA